VFGIGLNYSEHVAESGFAVGAHSAPLLGLSEHADPQEYWQRRSQFTEAELARIFLPAAGVTDWLVDTGYAEGVADVAQLAEWSGGHAHEVVRVEQVAEQAVHAPGDYATGSTAISPSRPRPRSPKLPLVGATAAACG
jgi:predicted TIM-barrel fold metal-dependent hydrolase